MVQRHCIAISIHAPAGSVTFAEKTGLSLTYVFLYTLPMGSDTSQEDIVTSSLKNFNTRSHRERYNK